MTERLDRSGPRTPAALGERRGPPMTERLDRSGPRTPAAPESAEVHP
jgi:hypothetical protein